MSIRIDELNHIDFSEVIEPAGAPIAPISPGEVLRADFLEPLALSANALAGALNVPTNRITGILAARRRVSADTALRLARYFGVSADFWLGLQASYDLERAKADAGERIASEVGPRAA
jgi:addiction module HigA family antidote